LPQFRQAAERRKVNDDRDFDPSRPAFVCAPPAVRRAFGGARIACWCGNQPWPIGNIFETPHS
jgi:hypothetical protein